MFNAAVPHSTAAPYPSRGYARPSLAQHRGLVPLLPAFGHPAVENAVED